MAPAAAFCPYAGLLSYSEEMSAYFFGRAREQRLIASSLFAAPVTVVYGATGVGKSSVLRAGVVPALRKSRRTAVVYFKQWQDCSFTTFLKAECVSAVEKAAGKPLGLDLSAPFPDLFSALCKSFNGAILVILDQFEEYFLYHPEADAAFDGELAVAINGIDNESGFVIGLRDDWLSRLDRFDARIPNLLGSAFRIEHLKIAAAEEALRKPLDVYNRNFANAEPVTIEDELVHSILNEVRTGKLQTSEFGGAGQTENQAKAERIETPFLQLVMVRLWDEEINKNGSRVLRLSTFESLGKADAILQKYLAKVMGELTDADREICARIFQYLVTPNFKKIAQETSNLVAWAGSPGDTVRPVLQKLTARSVLRRISPPARYEIMHDVLGRPILEWRAQYIQAQKQIAAEREAALEAARQEDEARRQRELADVRARALRRTRRFALAAIIAAGVAILAMIAAVISTTQVRRLWVEARVESVENFISDSTTTLDTDPELSVLLAVKADSDLARLPPSATTITMRGAVANALNRAVQNSWLRQSVSDLGKNRVWAISFTPDGKLMAAAEAGGTVRVWDVASRKQLASFAGEGSEITITALSPDGRFLATADLSRRLRVWILASGRPVALGNMAEGVTAVAFSNDGMFLAVGGIRGTVTVYDGHTGKVCFARRAHANAVTALAFDTSGRRLATAGADLQARVWEIATGRLIQTVGGHAITVLAIAFSNDGKRLATSSADQTAKIWDIATGRYLYVLSGTGNDFMSLCFSPNGNRIATGSEDGRVTLWDTDTGKQLMDLIGNQGAVLSISFDRDGDHLVTGSQDRAVRFWNVPRIHPRAVEDVEFSPDGQHLASASLDGTAELWDQDASRVLKTFNNGFHQRLFGIAVSPNGHLVATISHGGNLTVYDAATGRVAALRKPGRPSGLSFSPDAQRLASAGGGYTAIIWNLVTGGSLTLTGHGNIVNDVAFSPDGKLVATASYDWTAAIWDASTGKRLYELTAHHSPMVWVAFSPDGRRLATASRDTSAILWDFQSGKLTYLNGHAKSLEGIAFSPDGNRVATASLDQTARVWDAHTGAELFRFNHPSGVEQVSFSPDGKRLATACDDGMVRVFILDDAELLRIARQRATRTWTQGECQEYLHEACPRDLTAPPAGPN